MAFVQFLRPSDSSGANLWGKLKALRGKRHGVKKPWKLKALKTVVWGESKGKGRRINSLGIKGKSDISATWRKSKYT